MDKAKIALGVALVALVVAAGGYFYPTVAKTAAQTFGEIGTRYPNGIWVGTIGSATREANLSMGPCYFAPSATTIAASTSIAVDCQATAGVAAAGESALAGVLNNDNIQITLSTTTARSGVGSSGSLVVGGASASSTPGYITVWLWNQTGTTYTWPTVGSASGTAYYHASR